LTFGPRARYLSRGAVLAMNRRLSVKKRVAFAAVAVVLAVLVLGGVLELVARLLPGSDRFIRPTDAELLSLIKTEPILLERGEELVVNPFFAGADKIRARRFPKRPVPGEVRLLALGDSTVWGVVRGEDTRNRDRSFPKQLEELIAARNPNATVRVINLGAPGLTTHQLRAIAPGLLAMSPQAVILYIGHNDLNLSLRGFALATPSHSLLRRYSFAWGALASLRRGPTPRSAMGTTPRPPTKQDIAMRPLILEQFGANYREILHTFTRAGILVVACDLLSMATADIASPHGTNRQRGLIQRLALEENALFFPTVDRLRGALEAHGLEWRALFSDYVHPTKRGYFWLAEALYDELAPRLGLMPPPSPQ
jgi:lysophospholipase L1-like esterase